MKQLDSFDTKIIREVNQLAYQSATVGFDPFAAILVRNKQVKFTTTDKCIRYSDPTAHAELILISEFCRKYKLSNLEGFTLYCNVEPCVMCSGAIHWAKLSKVVFSVPQTALQKVSKGKTKPSCESLINIGNKKIEIIGPVLIEEGLKVIQAFPFLSKKERHQQYWKNQKNR